MKKVILLLILSSNLYSFDNVEIEQILYVKDKISEVNRLIQNEKIPSEIKILGEIKKLIIKNDYSDLTIYISEILKTRKGE